MGSRVSSGGAVSVSEIDCPACLGRAKHAIKTTTMGSRMIFACKCGWSIMRGGAALLIQKEIECQRDLKALEIQAQIEREDDGIL